MPIKKAKKKTPLPNAILKNKEFLRMVDILIDCHSSDPEKARRAQDAAVEIAAANDMSKKMRTIDGIIKADFRKLDSREISKIMHDSPACLAALIDTPPYAESSTPPPSRKHSRFGALS